MEPFSQPQPDTFYHVTPLHYAPYLLWTGCLFSQAEIRNRALPLSPRVTVARRERKLHLDTYVHLSPRPHTPLLVDKFQRGYPHVRLVFSGAIARLPGAGLLKYNPKSWRHRDDFIPVTGAEEQAAVWEAWQRGKYPSLELLIPDALPLFPSAHRIETATDEDTEWLQGFYTLPLSLVSLPIAVVPHAFPPLAPHDRSRLTAYAEACQEAGEILPPPGLPFD